MANKMFLLLIDPQEDFCNPQGALYVNGANEDMDRVAKMIDRVGDKFDAIHITLDSHQEVHIAHPISWKDPKGNHPDPFTIIGVDDVRAGRWMPTLPSLYPRFLNYVETLASNGRYPLCIWPPHCIIGTQGHLYYGSLRDPLRDWARKNYGTIDFLTKGSNIFTEHYSAIAADVPDPTDPSTQINMEFLSRIDESDVVLLGGEAGSHCLANTARDIINNIQNTDFVKKLVLLEDATSPVKGYEHLQEQFVKDMKKIGMRTAKTTDF